MGPLRISEIIRNKQRSSEDAFYHSPQIITMISVNTLVRKLRQMQHYSVMASVTIVNEVITLLKWTDVQLNFFVWHHWYGEQQWPRLHVVASVANLIYGNVYPHYMLVATSASLMKPFKVCPFILWRT